MSEKGKVYLIGAGCGKYDLITLRGKRLLEESDVVVYDSLVDRRLLGFAGKNAELISVGKRCGKPSEKQENINEILVQKALAGKTVARLKGGDPFVFGRGGEEIFALKEAGLEYEVIPGITSCAAVPELAGIPVTHRKVSRGFHVVTGHTAEDLLPENMSALAKENDTLVFLMGFSRLREIAEILVNNGKSPDTPAAVISNGCTSSQRVVRGKLSDIAEISEKSEMCSPAVIVVGETAGLREMVRETRVSKSELIYPIFIEEGEGIKKPVDSMPGVYRYSIDTADEMLSEAAKSGVSGVLIFGIPAHKDEQASSAYDENGVTQTEIRYIKKNFPELLVIADVCLCEYTSHGHCGVVCDGKILND